MPQNAFTFEEDDKQPSSGGFSWDSDKTAPPREEAKQANTSGSSAEPSTWEKLTRGYNPNVEDWASKHPIAGPAVRLLDAAGGAGMSTPGSIIEMVRHPIDTAEGIGSSLAAWGKPETWKAAPSVLPEALGQGIGSVAAGEALSVPSKMVAAKAGPAISGAREAVGAKIRTPEGALKPDVRLAAKAGGMAAGAGAGELVGHPWIGGYIGGRAGPRILQKVFPDSFDATRENIPYAGETSPPVSQAPAGLPTVEQSAPAPSVRRTPGQVAPDRIAQAPQERVPLTPMTPPTVNLPGGEAMRGPQPLLPASTAPKEASAGLPSVEGPAKPTGTALGRLEGLIREAAGTPELKPNVPLRQQSVGAAGQGFPAVGDTMQNLGGQVSFRREPIIKTVPGLEEGPLRAQAPEKLPAVATEEPARQLGAPPLQPAVPLRQQVKVTGMEPISEKARLQAKYPDREIRQLAHINGEELYDAAKNDRETLLALTKLENPDMREVAINGGINMVGENGSPIMVNNRKASGDISRQEVFKQLLAKGYTPKQILDLAKQSP